jgi:hypothetical protein
LPNNQTLFLSLSLSLSLFRATIKEEKKRELINRIKKIKKLPPRHPSSIAIRAGKRFMTKLKVATSHYTATFNAPRIAFQEGLPDLENIDPSQSTLLVLDDLMDQCGQDTSILNLFTTDSHRKSVSVIFVTHNVFSNYKHFRTISLNCQYIILLNIPRDQLQITHLGRQMFPGKSDFFSRAYADAVTSKHFGYLLVDLTQEKNFLSFLEKFVPKLWKNVKDFERALKSKKK